MVEIKIREKTYYSKGGWVKALEDVNLSFNDKGLYLICGESGCGKTTLLNCIGGLDSFKGTIKIDQNEYKNLVSYKERISNISYIFQDLVLKEDLSVYNNLKLFIDDKEKIIDSLKQVGIAQLINRKVSTLSGGQKQRVAIARCICLNPKIILADEPMAYLDIENKKLILNILKRLSLNYLVILVSHEKEIAKEYADTLITISNGRISNVEENSSNIKVKENKIEDNKEIWAPKEEEKFNLDKVFYTNKKNIISKIGYIIAGIAMSFLLFFSNVITTLNNNITNEINTYSKEVIIKKDENSSSFNQNDINTINSYDSVEYISLLPGGLWTDIDITTTTQQSSFSNTSTRIRTTFIKDYLQGEIIYGRARKSNFEVVIDEHLASALTSNSHNSISNRESLGIRDIQNIINSYVSINTDLKAKIVGIAKGNSSCFYASEEFINATSIASYDQVSDINLIYDKELLGDYQINENEIILDKLNYDYYQDHVVINDKQYKIKGYFNSDIYHGGIILNSEIENIAFNNVVLNSGTIYAIASDLDKIKAENSNYLISTVYDEIKENGWKDNLFAIVTTIIIGAAVFLICFFAIFIVKKNEIINEGEKYFFDLLFGKSKAIIFLKYLVSNLFSALIFALAPYLISAISLNTLVTSSTISTFVPIPAYLIILGIFFLLVFYTLVSFITYISQFGGTIISLKNKIDKEK